MSMAISARPRHYKQSLARTMLFTLLLLSMVPLLLLGSLAYMSARILVREQAFEQLAAVAESQGKQMDAQVGASRLLVAQAAADPGISEGFRALLGGANPKGDDYQRVRQQVLDGLQSSNRPRPFFQQYLVVLPGGMIQIATNPEWEGLALTSPAFENELSGKDASLALSDLPPLYNQDFIVAASIPIMDESGSAVATLLAIAESSTVRSMIDSAVFYSNSHYFVTGSGDFAVLNPSPTSPKKLIFAQPTDSQTTRIANPLMQDRKLRGVEELTSWDEKPVFAAFTWVPTLKTGWVAEIPQSRVYGQIDSLLIYAVLFLGGTVILMAGALWIATRFLVNPLIQLTQVVQHFADGDWSQRAVVKRKDEVGLLADSFNRLAEELIGLYHSLEAKVATRTSQIQAAADVSHIAISSATPRELLDRTLVLVRERFNISYAAIYQMDDAGEYVILRQAQGAEGPSGQRQGARLRVDSSTIVGRAAALNRPQMDRLQSGAGSQREDVLTGAVMEGSVPVAIGSRVLAVLHVLDKKMGELDEELLAELQTLANQIAPALQSFNLQESTQTNLQETRILYQASREVTQAETIPAVLEITRQALRSLPYASIMFVAEAGELRKTYERIPAPALPDRVSLDPGSVYNRLPADASVIITDFKTPPPLPEDLVELGKKMQCAALAYLPIVKAKTLTAIIVLGVEEKDAGKRMMSAPALEPYTNFVALVNMVLEKIYAVQNIEKRAAERHTLDVISNAISIETELDELYRELHKQLNSIMGEVDFFIALYDKNEKMIQIPYMMEHGEHLSIPPFPLGEGLTSILIQTQEPLLLVHETEKKASALGAIVLKGSAKSWLGVPMLLSGEPVGALVVQDMEKEGRFTEDDQRLLTTLAGQVAVAVRNVALLASTRQQAESERLLFDISSKLRRTTDMERILQITAEELGKALRLRRTQIKIQLKDDALPAASTADEEQPAAERPAKGRALEARALQAHPTNPESWGPVRRRNGDEA